jgi:hypothetical protein
MKLHRDLAIDAALHALIRLRAPTISNADILKRCRMEIGTGYYVAFLDGDPVATVTLHTDERFSISVSA